MSEIQSTHFFPVSITGTGAHTISTQGRQLNSTVKAVGKGFVSMGAATLNGSNDTARRFRGIEFAVASDAADGATGTIRVYRVANTGGEENTVKLGDEWDCQFIGSVAYTIGTQTGLDGGDEIVPTDMRLADTMVWTDGTTATTPKGIADYVSAAFSGGVSGQAYSPADNTTALCCIPDVGNGDIYFDLNATAAAQVKILTRKLT